MREMKDSGIPWLGEIPLNWKILKVKNVARRKSDKNKPDAQVLSLYRELGIVIKADRDDNHNVTSENTENYRFVEINDLVVNKMKAWQGSIAVSAYEGIVSPAYYVYRFNDKNIYPWFVHYVLRCKAYLPEYRRLSGGIRLGQWDLSDENFKNIPFPIPSTYEEQQKIADYLDSKCSKIDSIIAKQEEIIEKLKEYKLSVITEAVTKGLNPDVEMKDSGVDSIGRIPANWEVTKLGHLFDYLGGYAFKSDDYEGETNNQVIRIGNVKNDYLLIDSNPAYVSDDIAEKAKTYRVRPNTILFTMTGTRGKKDYFYTYLVSDSDLQRKKLFINQRVGCFIPKSDICVKYYNYLLKEKNILDSIFLYETGTANQANLGIDTIKRTKLQMPSYTEQEKIADYLNDRCRCVDKKVLAIEKIIIKLQEYKKSLIYEVVTGKKEV